MTRKRFVKLLMAAGYDRNKANALAADARSRGIEYSTAYITGKSTLSVGINWNDVNINAICDVVRKIADYAQKAAQAVLKATVAFVEAYTAEMEASNE